MKIDSLTREEAALWLETLGHRKDAEWLRETSMIHAINVAITQLGIHEDTGKNDGIPAERYMRGDELAWCAGFVLYCFDESDDPDLWDVGLGPNEGKDSDYWKLRNVATMESYMKDRGVWLGWNVPPQRNDIIFFANRGRSDPGSGRHVGIVEGLDGSTVRTIEGNVGNKVARLRHERSDDRITGFARIAPI